MSDISNACSSVRRRRRSGWIGVGRLIVILTLGLATLAAPARAAIATLTANPAAVTIQSGSSATVLLGGESAARAVELQIMTSPGVHAIILHAPDPRSPSGSPTWAIRLSVDPTLATDSVVTFQQLDHGAIRAVGQVKVTPKPGQTVAASVQGELVLDGDAVLEGRKTEAVLKLINLTDSDLTITSLRPNAPDPISIEPKLPTPAKLAARGVLLVPLTVGIAGDKVLASGKHDIGVVVGLARTVGAPPWTGDLAVSKEVAAGVPGMSDLQTVLQIPSLLFLPGLLVVVSFFAVKAMGQPPEAGKEGLARFAFAWSPWLWMSAITLSGAVVFIYPALTQAFGPVRRDILYGYGLQDLVLVWIGSIVAGAIAAGLVRLFAIARAWYRAERTFRAGEAPLGFLERLLRLARPFQLAYIEVDQHRLYRLDLKESGATVWAAPAIRFTPKDADFDARQIADALREGRLDALLSLLAGYAGAGLITLYWDDFGTVRGPTLVPITTFTALDPQHVSAIVREQ